MWIIRLFGYTVQVRAKHDICTVQQVTGCIDISKDVDILETISYSPEDHFKILSWRNSGPRDELNSPLLEIPIRPN